MLESRSGEAVPGGAILRSTIGAVLFLLSLASFSFAQTKSDPVQPRATAKPRATNEQSGESSRLPVKRVVLYKNGVGYFEHSTRVHADQELGIDFTTAQLNDVLKSLTVVDLGDGRISGVRYNSIAPLGERLKALRLPFGEQVSRTDFLTALRGARVEVRSKSETAVGRLLSVEQQERTTDSGTNYQATLFSVLTDLGEMKNFELGPTVSVRLAERELNDEVGRYLNLVGSSRARDLRRMTISATGSGDRDIFVSYISEVPVWKSTYRIILPEKASDKPLLQGWAIVDNTIGEDWKDVQLSLIAGSPQSFIQDISQPLYARRPVVPLPESAMLTPQTHEATVEESSEVQANELAAPSVLAPPPPPSATGGPTDGIYIFRANGAPARGRGFGTGAAQVAGSGGGRGGGVFRADSASLGKQSPEAEAAKIGDYFEYNLKQKITIGKNQSALVPILQAPIEAEKVTLLDYGQGGQAQVPLRAIWLKNTSGQILDSGSFNIIEGATFAGEGVLDSIHPDERRLLSYAADTAIHAKREDEDTDKPYSHVMIAKGVMVLTRERRQKSKFDIRNADKSIRTVVLELPVQTGWSFTKDTPKPEESTTSFHRFRVTVDAGKTRELTVESVYPELTQYALSNLDSNLVNVIGQQQRITPALQQVFDRVLAQKMKLSDLDQQIAQRRQETDQISADQNRIRENMKALKGSADEKALVQRYTGELNKQEDRLAAIRTELSDLQQKRNQAAAELDRTVMAINLDESF
jgi:hypothetical protein